MASFKYLIFITLAVYSVVAEEGVREKKHAYVAAAPAPILGYSVTAPGSFSYAYSGYNYPYHYPVAKAVPFHAAPPAPVAYPAAVYPATTYAAHAYPSYPEDDGQYWPGKYEKIEVPAYKTVYPSYAAEDDGQYWPGKYEKVDASAYKAEHHY